MAQSQLVLHCGAREASREDLAKVLTPAATATWFPVPHATVIDTVEQSLVAAGLEVRKARFGLSRGDSRMFGTLDLGTPLVSGVSLAVGVRNSLDKSFPLGFVAGSRTFVCDNLAFRSELLVKRKHTRFGQERFREAICQAVQSLGQFRQAEAERIRLFQLKDIDDTRAESLILRAYERGVVSHRQLPGVLKHWRTPEFEEFADRTVWSLFNAFTSALAPVGRSNPQRYCGLTMSLQGLLGEAAGLPAAPEVDHSTAA
jgi:hypothetical protein